jgi:hypothetical protein
MVALVGVMVACTDADQGASSCSDANIDFGLPTESFTDWVSYADQLSVVQVLAEKKLWRVPDPGAPPEKYVGRSVEIRVSDTTWRRPDAPVAPGRVWMTADFPGWLNDRGIRPVLWGEGPRLEVGRRYLMALARFDEGDWGAFPRATLPIEEDGTLADTCSKRPTLDALAGLTVARATKLVVATPPDPRVAGLGHLPPKERLQTVYRQSPPG